MCPPTTYGFLSPPPLDRHQETRGTYTHTHDLHAACRSCSRLRWPRPLFNCLGRIDTYMRVILFGPRGGTTQFGPPPTTIYVVSIWLNPNSQCYCMENVMLLVKVFTRWERDCSRIPKMWEYYFLVVSWLIVSRDWFSLKWKEATNSIIRV
jgi:hypothetical protein